MKWSALIAQTSSVRFELSEMILKNFFTRCGCLCLCCHVVSSLTYSGRQTHPASEGVNLHGALEGEETGEGGVHVVQDELVGVSLMVVLDDVATLINFSSVFYLSTPKNYRHVLYLHHQQQCVVDDEQHDEVLEGTGDDDPPELVFEAVPLLGHVSLQGLSLD